jgi:hypothetical protein
MTRPIRYGTRYGCRWGQPHDMARLGETEKEIWEQCKMCNKKFHWKKWFRGKVNNKEYLKAHVRQYAQEFGTTKRIYHKLYHPEKTIIKI